MKQKALLTAFACMAFMLSAFSQSDTLHLSGIIKGKDDGQPLAYATIRVSNGSFSTLSDANGRFKLNAALGNKVIVSLIGYKDTSIIVKALKSDVTIYLQPSDIHEETVSASISNKSYWSGASMGASLGYNVSSTKGGTNNIVGGATLIINPMSESYAKTEFAIVGNIANFMSTLSTTATNVDLSKLAQDNNGLSIGIGATREFPFGTKKNVAFRIYAYTMYQLNSFQKSGDTTHTSISQWKNTLGFELEGFSFKQGGVLTFDVSASYGIFDGNAYQKVFGEKKSAISSIETSVILPISNQFGFLFSGTYSQSFKPVFLLGIIIKTIDFDKTTIGASQSNRSRNH